MLDLVKKSWLREAFNPYHQIKTMRILAPSTGKWPSSTPSAPVRQYDQLTPQRRLGGITIGAMAKNETQNSQAEPGEGTISSRQAPPEEYHASAIVHLEACLNNGPQLRLENPRSACASSHRIFFAKILANRGEQQLSELAVALSSLAISLTRGHLRGEVQSQQAPELAAVQRDGQHGARSRHRLNNSTRPDFRLDHLSTAHGVDMPSKIRTTEFLYLKRKNKGILRQHVAQEAKELNELNTKFRRVKC